LELGASSFLFFFFGAGIIGDYVILKILYKKKTKTGDSWILKKIEKKKSKPEFICKIMENSNISTCKNIIVRKSSKRNQNPFKILL
jgi:hypothetical protein